jgi:cell wall-associated NlpC family hydrolase
VSFDIRETLVRDGLADDRLQGVLAAERFAATAARQAIRPAAAIRAAPEAGAEQLDQILFGERFDVLESRGSFALGQSARDGYVGWVETAALSDEIATATHWVAAPSTLAFAEPSIKTPATHPIPMNALVSIAVETESLARDPRLGWMPKSHLLPIEITLTDPAAAALAFLGAPYLWGGRGGGGVDCSGLVQQALIACGLPSARDSDQQESLGESAPENAVARGDLVFWKGHVAMMIDRWRMAHANAFHMAVAVEPLAKARERIAARGGGEPIAFRRLAPISRTPGIRRRKP